MLRRGGQIYADHHAKLTDRVLHKTWTRSDFDTSRPGTTAHSAHEERSGQLRAVMSHLAVFPSMQSLPCLAPRPHFPRNGFKVQHATRKSSQSMCGCVLGTVQPSTRNFSRLRRLHSTRTQAAQNSSSGSPALDTGQVRRRPGNGIALCTRT